MKQIDRRHHLSQILKRQQNSRISRDFQLIGLEIADILSDRKHKSLYIKYAKEYPASEILSLAKSVALRRNVKHPGAYFMRLLKDLPKKHAKPHLHDK